jgi:hypothetical protein
VTTQPIYLIPMARMTSTSDPHGIHYYDFPIAVPRKRIEITAVPEPATWALMIGGFALVGTLARRRHTARAPFIES